MSSLAKGAENAVKTCMNVKNGESVLIITDSGMDPEIPLALFKAAKEITENVEVVSINPLTRDGEEPAEEVANIMKATNVLFILTSKSLTHTNARRMASENGVRIASMPSVTEFSFKEGGMTADYNEVDALCKKMLDVIKNGRKFRVTSGNGTDVQMNFGKHEWTIDNGLYHNSGDFGNLPAGEVDTAPNEASTRGVIVFDKMGRYGDGIKVQVENGYAVKIEGSESLVGEVKNLGKEAGNIAELGIGTNPKAKLIGNVLEDEKVFQTVHIALGNNATYGGKCNVPLHVDGIIAKPTLEVDGRTIIKDGKWLIA
jgi:leucyl aminopeptidase (aminopeptidase T)